MITNEIQINKEDKRSPFYRVGFEKGFIDNEERFIYLAWINDINKNGVYN